MEKRYELFHRIISKLGETGILNDIVLIGSWCLYFYRFLFEDADTMPAIRTVDLDFLLSNPPRIRHSVNIPGLLEELGFVEEFSLLHGNSKFIHPDLEVEFIVPAKGRDTDSPYIVKEINVRAQRLRYVSLLQDHTISIPFKGFAIKVPEPAAFVLHKFQLSGKRDNKEKRIKDLETAVGLGEYLAAHKDQAAKMREIYLSLPVKWQKEILESTEDSCESIRRLLEVK